jgi:hypothetical protein
MDTSNSLAEKLLRSLLSAAEDVFIHRDCVTNDLAETLETEIVRCNDYFYDLARQKVITPFSKYTWQLTRDLYQEKSEALGFKCEKSCEGVCGPRNCDVSLIKNNVNPAPFALYDDDDNCMAEGMLYGEYDGLEPLDDYGSPNWGCTYIKVKGEII